MTEQRNAVCIGCGCDDFHACEGGCHWLRLDRMAGAGVCSKCESKVQLWDQQHGRAVFQRTTKPEAS